MEAQLELGPSAVCQPASATSMRRPPEPRDLPPRSSENDKRSLCPHSPTEQAINALRADADYEGYGKHKRTPEIWKLDRFQGYAPDRTFCEDAGFTLADRDRILPLLRRGIEAGLFSEQERQGVPAKLWTIDDNGWIYEFAITNVSTPLYHAYPVRRTDAMARKVIDRFELHALRLTNERAAGHLTISAALRVAREFYS